ncbi:MAG: hypothetical protein IJ814_08505 [Paludibacteraceae bacterium]|nr:hypothetical protein [Paludibacteraceae bacterium]
MKKIFTLFLGLAVAAVSMQAAVWLEENFNYPDGPLEQAGNDELVVGKWMQSLKPADSLGVSPVVANRNLTYPGYIASAQGKVAVLDAAVGDDNTTQRISVYYLDTLGARDTVSMYAAFLMKPLSAKNTSGRDFAIWEGSVTSSMCRGRLFLAKDGSAVKVGVTKNSSSISAWSESLEIGSVNLIVMKYEVVEGASNDVVKVWVNPSLSKTEAEQTPLATTDNATDMLVKGFGLRQRGNGVEIGGLRIGTSWADVVKSDGSDTPDEPEKPEVDPDIYAIEDFEYEAGSAIEGQGGWVVSSKPEEQDGLSPKVGAESLTYAGYGSGEGGALVLDSVAQEISGNLKRNTVMPFANAKLATDEVVYTALLVHLSEMNSTSGKDIFTYLKQGTAESTGTTMRGRVHVKIAKDKMVFGIHKNSQEITQWSDSLDKAETALLVVKYVNKSTGSSNTPDEFYLYVNPDPAKTEAENAAKMLVAEGNSADGGTDLRYLCFRQMKLNATFDGIRVAKTWEKALNYKAPSPEAIDNVQGNQVQYTKILRDGQLLIIRDGSIYTISGAKVQ